jgi:hypothetical protein
MLFVVSTLKVARQVILMSITLAFFVNDNDVSTTVSAAAAGIFAIGISGSAISKGREPESCLNRVFNLKLGSIVQQQHEWMVYTWPLLELKTRPKFCPAS